MPQARSPMDQGDTKQAAGLINLGDHSSFSRGAPGVCELREAWRVWSVFWLHSGLEISRREANPCRWVLSELNLQH